MGNKNTTTKTAADRDSAQVPSMLPGYPEPEPPLLCLDEIRPPIPWYQDDEDDDEFDWADVEAETVQTKDRFPTPGFRLDAETPRTPKSVLLNAVMMTGPLTNRPLLTASGRPISFVSQERTRSVVTKRSCSAASAGAVSLHSNIRRKKPTQSVTVSFEAIDEHTRKATNQHLLTFTTLVEYLKEPIKYHQYSEIMMTRAIIVWLAYQKVRKSLFAKADISSPQGLLQLLASEKLSYAAAFAVLCREAGLQCAIVEGVSKPSDLDPIQDTIDVLPDTWTCVYVEGEWQIVHPLWMCKGLSGSGASVDDWINRELKTESHHRKAVIQNLKQIVKCFINEDYFMPAPEVFVHSNFPNDSKWQLLQPEITITSIEAFTSLPFLFPAFFRLGLRMITEPNFILYSQEGKCRIWFITDYNNAHRLFLTYELHILRTNYPNSDVLNENIHRHVVHCRHNNKYFFEISFPIEGEFKLEVYGGYHKGHTMRLCYFKLICERRLSHFRYLPYYPGNLMWGPGPTCPEYGLLLPSKPTGIVKIYEQPRTTLSANQKLANQLPEYRPKQFTFNLHTDKSKCFEYDAYLLGYPPDVAKELASPFDEDGQLVDKARKRRKRGADVYPEFNPDYSFCVDCERRENKRQFQVNVTIPHDGDFALVIKAIPVRTDEETGNDIRGDDVDVCAYLLRTVIGASKESVHQKLARNELQRSMRFKDGDYIQSCIDRCIKVKMDLHDDDIAAAQTRTEYLNFRKNVLEAIHRRNYHFINLILSQVGEYRHREALTIELRRLFALRDQLKKLQEFKKYIPELQRAGNELVAMTDPPAEVHLTMGALLLLLEEPDRYIESWEYIVYQMTSENGNHSDAPIYKKMCLIADMCPSKNTRRKILTLLAEYHHEQVQRVSIPAAKFYVWVQKVMAVFQELEFDLEPKPNTKQIAVEVKGDVMDQRTNKESAGAHAQSVNKKDTK